LTDSDRLNLTGADGAVRLAIRVVPRAGRNALDGVTEAGALRVRLTAPPVEGAANAALIAFLADALGVPKRSITLVRGERGRDKVIEIAAPIAIIRERLRAATDRKSP
jgi:uncharacterized protein